MQSLIIDQEFKHLIPPLTTEEKTGLETMIVADGCREPLITWGGTLVDGHNRFEICTRLNIPFEAVDKFFDDRDAVVEWIIGNQLGRRNLTIYDRTRLVLRKEDVIQARAKRNQVVRKGDQSGSSVQKTAELIQPITTREELAKLACVSHDTVMKVKVIEAKATEEQKADLSAGKKKVGTVYSEIIKPERKKEVVQEKRDMKKNPYSNAKQFSHIAISQLSRIREEDPQRVAALMEVRDFIDNQLKTKGE